MVIRIARSSLSDVLPQCMRGAPLGPGGGERTDLGRGCRFDWRSGSWRKDHSYTERHAAGSDHAQRLGWRVCTAESPGGALPTRGAANGFNTYLQTGIHLEVSNDITVKRHAERWTDQAGSCGDGECNHGGDTDNFRCAGNRPEERCRPAAEWPAGHTTGHVVGRQPTTSAQRMA